MKELQLRFWGPWGKWLSDGGHVNDPRCEEYEREYCMLYGDVFAFCEYEPINDLLNLDYMDQMLWTGLQDKNGKDIYDGDIVIIRHSPAVNLEVRYTGEVRIIASKGACLYHPREVRHYNGIDKEKGHTRSYVSINAGKSEVIGNIYEHPELKEEI